MAKYLENPINPMIFMSYNQKVPDLASIPLNDERIERTIHLDTSYVKFRQAVPSLICVGCPSSRKSTLLNDTFGSEFEVIE